MQSSIKIRLAIGLVLLVSLASPATSAAVSFGATTDCPVGLNPAAVVAGDFNGDGKLDLAVVNSGSSFVGILLGNGDGTFQPARMTDAGGPQSSIVVGDFNGDGKLDIVVNSGPGATGAPRIVPTNTPFWARRLQLVGMQICKGFALPRWRGFWAVKGFWAGY